MLNLNNVVDAVAAERRALVDSIIKSLSVFENIPDEYSSGFLRGAESAARDYVRFGFLDHCDEQSCELGRSGEIDGYNSVTDLIE